MDEEIDEVVSLPKGCRVLTVMLILLILALSSACSPSPLAQSELPAVAAERLAIAAGELHLDGTAVADLVADYESSDAPLAGISLTLRQGGKLYWLRYPTKDIPAPYTPYDTVVTKVGNTQSPARVNVASNFVLQQAWDAKAVVWMAGHMNSGRINYWDVLYIYDTQAGSLRMVNEMFERNSVVIDKVYARYADVTVSHRADQPPFDDDGPPDSSPAYYRVYSDGRTEPRKP